MPHAVENTRKQTRITAIFSIVPLSCFDLQLMAKSGPLSIHHDRVYPPLDGFL
jgi:hypothetical protein